MMNNRATKAGFFIDRRHFYPISDKNIMHMSDGLVRNVNRTDFDSYVQDTNEGWQSITNISYTVLNEQFTIMVHSFDSGREENLATSKSYNLTNGPAPFKTNLRRGAKMSMIGF
jgi:hypothetical protein